MRRSHPRRPGRAADRVLASPGSLPGVLPGDAASLQVWAAGAAAGPKPVVIVPAAARPAPQISRALMPLDGTPQSAAAVATTRRLADAGVDLVVLHVFDAATVPKFWDQPAHAEQAWPGIPGPLLRSARRPARVAQRGAAEHVLEVAAAEQADMIALAWSQQLDQGRAPGPADRPGGGGPGDARADPPG